MDIQQKVAHVMQMIQSLQIQATYGNTSTVFACLNTLQEISNELDKRSNAKSEE